MQLMQEDARAFLRRSIPAFDRQRQVSRLSLIHIYYYVQESVGIACGFLIAALHWMGLVTLTHTPSPMGFLSQALDRPPNEKPYLLIPVGFPANDARVPNIGKKSLNEIAVFVE